MADIRSGSNGREDIRRGSIWFVDKANGWIVIHGIIGTRKYLYYSEREARRLYRNEVLRKRCCFGKTVIYM